MERKPQASAESDSSLLLVLQIMISVFADKPTFSFVPFEATNFLEAMKSKHIAWLWEIQLEENG